MTGSCGSTSAEIAEPRWAPAGADPVAGVVKGNRGGVIAVASTTPSAEVTSGTSSAGYAPKPAQSRAWGRSPAPSMSLASSADRSLRGNVAAQTPRPRNRARCEHVGQQRQRQKRHERCRRELSTPDGNMSVNQRADHEVAAARGKLNQPRPTDTPTGRWRRRR